MKTINVVGINVAYTCSHIQRKTDDKGNVRTLCGQTIAQDKLKPVQVIKYDVFRVRSMSTLRDVKSVLLSNCHHCLRLESGLSVNRVLEE